MDSIWERALANFQRGGGGAHLIQYGIGLSQPSYGNKIRWVVKNFTNRKSKISISKKRNFHNSKIKILDFEKNLEFKNRIYISKKTKFTFRQTDDPSTLPYYKVTAWQLKCKTRRSCRQHNDCRRLEQNIDCWQYYLISDNIFIISRR